MDALKRLLTERPSVVARARDDRLIPGYLEKGQLLARGILKMSGLNGEPLNVDVHKLKGVFFVRDFVGDRDYLEEKTLGADPELPGLRARIRFEDNETLEGITENSLDLLSRPGFFFWPADANSNNRLIYVVKGSLIGFRVLSVKHR